MEKVKITQEQAGAIEHLRDLHFEEMNRFKKYSKCNVDKKLIPLHDLEIDKINDAYFDGYEVKPDFEVGDWIVYENEYHKCVMQITDTDKHYVYVEPFHNGFKNCTAISKKSPLIKHATPEEIAEEKERRFFARHGREPWELKYGDILVNIGTGFPAVVTKGLNIYQNVDLNLKRFNIQAVKDNYRVASFVDGRLDVKRDD